MQLATQNHDLLIRVHWQGIQLINDTLAHVQLLQFRIKKKAGGEIFTTLPSLVSVASFGFEIQLFVTTSLSSVATFTRYERSPTSVNFINNRRRC